MKVLAVVPGPDTHGVVRHALSVAAAVGADVRRELGPVQKTYDVVHVPFTDSLFGRDIAAAAAAFEAWTTTVEPRVVVTLHDVPGADTDAARDARRRAGYLRVAAACDAVIVCSAAEAGRLRPRPVVVPLPVTPLAPAGPVPAWAGRPSLGVLGFVYPGKGHEQALAAAAGTGAQVLALGAVTPGHEPLLELLRQQADALGVTLHVTGPLSEPDLHAAALAVTVPVAAYCTTGASASLRTWTAVGRRPVTTTGAYALELEQAHPGSLWLTDDLPRTVRCALADPGRTRATPSRPVDVAAAHLAVYRSVLR